MQKTAHQKHRHNNNYNNNNGTSILFLNYTKRYTTLIIANRQKAAIMVQAYKH